MVAAVEVTRSRRLRTIAFSTSRKVITSIRASTPGLEVVLQLDPAGDVGCEPVVAAPPAGAVPPLGQADDRRCGDRKWAGRGSEGDRHLALEVVGEVGDEHADEEVPQAGDLLRVPEEGLRRLPERGRPGRTSRPAPRRGAERPGRTLAPAPLGVGVEERAEDGEPLGLVGLDDHGDHLAVEVSLGVVGGDEALELLEPILVVAELAAVREVLTEVLAGQPQFVEQERCPVGPEAAGVEADVEQPVILEVGLLGGGVQQETGRGLVTLDADLGFEGTHLIEPQPRTFSSMRNGRVFWNSRSGSFQKTIRCPSSWKSGRAPC